MCKLKISLAFALFGAPALALAVGIPTNFATLPPGSQVTGTAYCACSAVNGNFVQSIDLSASQQNLEQAILAVGKVLNTGQMQQMTALEQELNQVLQEQAQFQKDMKLATNVNWNNKQLSASDVTQLYGKTVEVNQPGILCNETSMAQNLGQGLAANRQMAGGFGSVLAEYNQSDQSAMSSVKNLANTSTGALSASSIFPTAMASSVYPTSADAVQTIAHLTEPVPPEQLTAAQKKTAAGVLWRASENAIQAKMSMAQNALSTIAVWHQPTIDASYFVSKWQSMQSAAQSATGSAVSSASTNPPGVSAGKISPDGALNLMVQARYANPSWYSRLAVQSQSGAIKDLTEMEAVSLRTHWEALRMSEYLAGLSADQYAHEVVTPTNKALNHLNANVMAQKNGAFNER